MRLTALEIPAQPEFVSLARLVVSSVASDRYELSDDQLESLKLAISEACVMAIQGLSELTENTVVIECDGRPDRIEVCVNGHSGAFSEDVVPMHSPGMVGKTDFDREFGLPLIDSLVDSTAVTSDENGDHLRMTLMSELAEQL